MSNLNSVLGSVDYDQLFAGPNRSYVRSLTVTATGSALKRGEIVNFADGKAKAIAQNKDAVFGVVAYDVDASEADVPVTVYLNGDFNKAKITAANSVAVDDLFLSARNVGIILR